MVEPLSTTQREHLPGMRDELSCILHQLSQLPEEWTREKELEMVYSWEVQTGEAVPLGQSNPDHVCR